MSSVRLLSLFTGVLCLGLLSQARGSDFFEIHKIDYLKKMPKRGTAVLEDVQTPENLKKKAGEREKIFVPCLEVDMSVAEQTRTDTMTVKAYFFSVDKKLIGEAVKPAVVQRGKDKFAMPVIWEKSKKENIFFPVPKAAMNLEWTAIVVFGDSRGAVAELYPASGQLADFDFPEKRIVENPDKTTERKAAMDPVVEQVVKTDNEAQPQITLFMRPPKGVVDGADVKGVVALSILANSPDEIRQFLQGRDPGWKMGYVLDFADQNKLAIIAWGARRPWGGKAGNYFELSDKRLDFTDEAFDQVSKGWERGIKKLVATYGIPSKNYLLWGASGAANWAHRLALRKPQYFAAVHVEILSNFDKPSLEANKVMWLLTTGELEGGYESSKKFYLDCKKLGYPIVYKAYPRIGHASCVEAQNLGREFFQFALQQVEASANIKADFSENLDELVYNKRMAAFKGAAFYGDIVNQGMVAADKIDEVPEGFRVALPTKKIADLWNKQ